MQVAVKMSEQTTSVIAAIVRASAAEQVSLVFEADHLSIDVGEPETQTRLQVPLTNDSGSKLTGKVDAHVVAALTGAIELTRTELITQAGSVDFSEVSGTTTPPKWLRDSWDSTTVVPLEVAQWIADGLDGEVEPALFNDLVITDSSVAAFNQMCCRTASWPSTFNSATGSIPAEVFRAIASSGPQEIQVARVDSTKEQLAPVLTVTFEGLVVHVAATQFVAPQLDTSDAEIWSGDVELMCPPDGGNVSLESLTGAQLKGDLDRLELEAFTQVLNGQSVQVSATAAACTIEALVDDARCTSTHSRGWKAAIPVSASSWATMTM
jgi:hypothetical protein